MKIDSEFSNGVLNFSFQLDSSDREHIQNSVAKINEDVDVFVDLEGHVKELHPDQIALTAILIFNPFIGQQLSFSWPVSNFFHENVSTVISRYEVIKNCNMDIEPMKKTVGGRPALAFSGGADSTAALAVLPSDTIPIFLKRPEDEDSLYDLDAPLEICNSLEECGYDVRVIESNLEHVRSPIGFPTDLAHSAPIVLLAKDLGIGSISFGTIMESGYGIGHKKFHNYEHSAHKRFYTGLFGAIGIDLSMPVMGISEVGTAMICENSPFGFYSQSCIRGTWLRPCLSCWKCFRKRILNLSLGIEKDIDLTSMMMNNEVQKKLSEFPISHENVILYAIQKMDLDDYPYLKPLASKLELKRNVDFLETWYPASINLVPDEIRHSVRNKILKFLEIMSPSQQQNFYDWDMNPHLISGKTRSSQEKLTSFWQDFSLRFD